MKRLSIVILLLIFSFSITKAQPGSIDWSFQPDFDFQKTDGFFTLAFDKENKIVVGGKFLVPRLNGNTLKDIIRIEKSGKLDTNFKNTYRGIGNKITSIAVQDDGKVVVGRSFDTDIQKIIRYNKDGNIDKDFNSPPLFRDEYFRKIFLQPDNKIIGIISNPFKSNDKIIRLNSNGAMDSSFKEYRIDFRLLSIAIQSNGKIIVGSVFTNISEDESSILIRLNSNGTKDTTFFVGNGFKEYDYVTNIIIQPDGKILASGNFQSQLDSTIVNITRLEMDGKLDNSFNTELGFEYKVSEVRSIYLQQDGKIILGGDFTTFNGIKNKNIVRLNKNGTIDTAFNTGDGFNGSVTFIGSQIEGKIIVAGAFDDYNNNFIGSIVCLNTKNLDLNFSIFPSPSTGILTINSSQSLNLITIIDAVGKEILRTTPMAFDAEIDLSDKSSGVYFVTVFSDGGSKCQKILKR